MKKAKLNAMYVKAYCAAVIAAGKTIAATIRGIPHVAKVNYALDLIAQLDEKNTRRVYKFIGRLTH